MPMISENLKDFVTDDGALLRQKLAGAGFQITQTTRTLGSKLGANGRVLLEKGKDEMQRRRNTEVNGSEMGSVELESSVNDQ